MIDTDLVATCPLCQSPKYTPVVNTKDYGFSTCDNEFTYVECQSCSALYLRNRPLLSKLDLIYPAEYTAFHPSNKASLVQRARDLVQLKKYRFLRRYVAADDSILEFGCGSGELLRVIKGAHGQTHSLLGIDFSDYAAQHLREHGIEFWKGDILDYQPAGKKFGAVILNAVIEHLADPNKVTAKIHQLLQDGGIVYMETPACGAWDSLVVPLKYWGGWHAPRHFVIFSERTLRQMLEKNNFRVLSVSYIFSPFLWANSFQFYLEQELGWRRLASLFRISFFPYLCFIGLVELLQLLVTGRTSNIRIVAQKI